MTNLQAMCIHVIPITIIDNKCYYLIQIEQIIYMISIFNINIYTNQSLVFERVINTAHEKPEGPQVLKAKLQKKVCHEYKAPHQQKFQIQECTVSKK